MPNKTIEEVKYIRNSDGEIVGAEFKETLSLKELELAYPRHLYPQEWAKLDAGQSTTIITPANKQN